MTHIPGLFASGPAASGLLRHQGAEGFHHLLVDRALERDDEFGQAAHVLPAPFVEFRLVVAAAGLADVDLALIPLEAEGEPALGLPAVAPAPGAACRRACCRSRRRS